MKHRLKASKTGRLGFERIDGHALPVDLPLGAELEQQTPQVTQHAASKTSTDATIET